MTRTILHLDLDAFYCTVEELHNPRLRGKPFAVGGRPEQRGVVASCSYAARAFGVRSAMPMGQARNLCPRLIVVPPNFPAYRAASEQVMARLRALTAELEQISIDEAFLDISAVDGPPETVALALQQQIRDELGLACSLGVAANKLVAKIATDVGKARARTGDTPNALCVVPPGTEAVFLAPLDVGSLWGVGPKTQERLGLLGITTIGDLANWPTDDLIRRFGQHGGDMALRAQGIDSRPIVTERETKSISKETTFSRDVRDTPTLHAAIEDLAGQVGARLARNELFGTTIKLKLRWSDFTTLTRQATLPRPTASAEEICEQAVRLLHQVWDGGESIRLIGVGISGFDVPRQMQFSDLGPF